MTHQVAQKTRHFTNLTALPPDKLIPGPKIVEKKRKHFPERPHVNPSSFVLPHNIHCRAEEY